MAGKGWAVVGRREKMACGGKQEVVQGIGEEGAQGKGKRRQGPWLLSPYSAIYVLPPL